MTDVQMNGHKEGEAPALAPPEDEVVPQSAIDTSYEVPLDDDPEETQPVHPPGGFKLPDRKRERLPIIPKHLRTAGGFRKHVGTRVGDASHIAAFHGLRTPWYALQHTWWTTAGAFVLGHRVRRWWWVDEHAVLSDLAVIKGDSKEWRSLTSQVRKIRGERGVVVVTCAIAVLVAVAILARYAPWWVDVIVAAPVAVLLSRAGRPRHVKPFTPSMTQPRMRVIREDVVLRAFYVARLGDPEKADQHITFAAPGITRDGDGSRIIADLPHGKTYADLVKVKLAFCSGLDVKATQVYFTADPSSERRVVVWIADEDPLAIPAGRTPLLDCKRRSVWAPAPFGLDERGRKVMVDMVFHSFLVGAQPRKGKTFSARLLALYAALDPYTRLTVVDGKASPDWRSFRLVAHRAIFGTHPTRDGDPVEQLLDALREIKAHIMRANDFLSGLSIEECPYGKNTEELSRKYEQLRVWLLVMEEFQTYFELEDQEANKEVAALLGYIIAVGPSVGVILLDASQKPGGVGAGDVGRLFTRFRDNHEGRFALKCGNRIVSDAILGGDAYAEGFDASALPVGKKYRGVGILYGLHDEVPVVRTYLADGEDAYAILLAAREHREKAGTLTGMAADEEMVKPGRDVLADVLAVFTGREAGLQWQVVAGRLAEQIPERWEGSTADAVSAQLRDFGVPSVGVKAGGRNLKGCKKADVERAMGRS